MLKGLYDALKLEREESLDLLMLEQRLRFGILQCLKWVMEFATEKRKRKTPSWSRIHSVIELGSDYEVIVDYLKCANHNLLTILVDQGKKIVTIYEGGDITGADAQLFYAQYERLPSYSHVDLTQDSDQLTAKWTAGEFRSAVKYLSDLALEASDMMCLCQNGHILPLFPRPTLVTIPSALPDPGLSAVIDDLTLTPEKIQGSQKWRFVSLLETPLILVGKRRLGVSDILITSGQDVYYDYMLRIANRVDPAQYTKVSGLREERMIDICRKELEAKGWQVQSRTRISDPLPREIDLMAYRQNISVLFQLKSTLRPETPWETYKRNEDILHGIQHTSEIVDMLSHKPIPFLITDGYRGDHTTWASAFEHNIPIGTLRDVEDIATDPHEAILLLKQRVGFDSSRKTQPLPDRIFEMMGWKMRIIDARPPAPAC